MNGSTTPINVSRLADNECFGCGHHNPHGLKISLYPQQAADVPAPSVSGEFTPAQHLHGFPGITHGGILYAAMDCTATWTAYVGKPDTPAIWILRNADVTYHRPALAGTRIRLQGQILEDAEDWHALIVQVSAHSDDELLAQGKFKVIPLPADKFKAITGNKALPENFAAFLQTLDPTIG